MRATENIYRYSQTSPSGHTVGNCRSDQILRKPKRPKLSIINLSNEIYKEDQYIGLKLFIEESEDTHLVYTGFLGGLEHRDLKIETRLIGRF